ncbi:hypothetical protein BJI69_11190 [Luteibacter rhizovicinus DSM 16549]|uniref:Uncharacterized protein n=1 Tax=Luteibacter rhizovicinus DSM 16549 TaxID=1440763 RepID=A0A0G9H913_9GAMM|nr:hypothetical protein BJI69_11190 [Luteibacter rhizovicinus DSM 16549]KLD66290.1 hypothetical protein Y883_14915 [Luteibacter rhizovicinus DSM 16549]
MKALWSIVGFSVAAVIVGLGGPVRSEGGRTDAAIAAAVAGTTTRVDIERQASLVRALSTLPEKERAATGKNRGARCYYNCPPPIGSVTASPQVVSMPPGALGSVTIHWRWDQSATEAVTQHSCLWVSKGDESEAHLVKCKGPGLTYATTVGWIGSGNYIFRVAPGNPKGPFSKPVAGLFQLAQTIVVGAAL